MFQDNITYAKRKDSDMIGLTILGSELSDDS